MVQTLTRASEGSTGTPEKSVGNEAPAAPAPGPDVGVPGASRNPQQVAAQRRLQQTQAQVDEVVDLMKTNVEKVLERDHKLNELELRADGLEAGASQFEKQAKSLKSKFWLENMKMIIVGVVVLGLIIILIYWFSGASSVVDAVMSKDSPPTTAQPVTTPHEKTDAPQKLAETNSGSASLPVKVLESPKIASTFDVLKVLAKDLGIGND